MRTVILVFVVRFKSFNVFEGDSLGGVFVNTFLYKAIKIGFGENHPSFLPLFEMTRTLYKKAFLDLVVSNIGLDTIIRIHHLYIYL